MSSSGRNPTKGGRGGAVAGGRGQSHGPGRTVEVTPTAGGSYVIEKPPSVDGAEGGARVRPPREEGSGRGGFGGKQQGAGRGAPAAAGGRGAREARPPRTSANAGDASSADASAAAVDSGKSDNVVKEESTAPAGGRPKSGGAASGKLFSKAMDQASSGGGKASKKVSRRCRHEHSCNVQLLVCLRCSVIRCFLWGTLDRVHLGLATDVIHIFATLDSSEHDDIYTTKIAEATAPHCIVMYCNV